MRALAKAKSATLISAAPLAVLGVVLLTLLWWFAHSIPTDISVRRPGADSAPDGLEASPANPVLSGKLLAGPGTPASLHGAWTGFRGANLDGVAATPVTLLRQWSAEGPRPLWSVDLGEGYAGAAVANGRVYVVDYDQEKKQDAIRCLSLADGKEIWRFTYANSVKRNHGMSRTVPAIAGDAVITIGPKLHVTCLDAASGALRWSIDLVSEYGATVPPWYAGQNPLIDGDRLILAPGGKDALMIAVSLAKGELLWRTPNPQGWLMTHSSIVPVEIEGQRLFVYCASHGVAGVAAEDGSLRWETSDWKISIATIPSPVALGDGRLFFSGGYNAGALMLRVKKDGDRLVSETLFRLRPEVFGSTQHTPVHFKGRLFGIRPDGQLVCLDLDGNVVWTSGAEHQFGLGPLLVANDVIFAMNDSGKLSLIEASPERFALLSHAKVLDNRESWAPFALAGGRLLARDFTRMVCLEVGKEVP